MIYIARYEPNRQGGGWSFQANFAKAMAGYITESYDEADTYFITSPSMVQREEVQKAQADGKKIILRIDNALRNSRNRNTGMTRMKSMAEMADLVVFQSEWAKAIIGDMFLGKDLNSTVILNACDTSIFNGKGRDESATARYIYSRVNRDETKNWEMARFIYMVESANRGGDALLNIVGAYSPELVEYNFDFYNDENYRYWGVVADPNAMAAIYRNCDYLIYPFFNDACSNTLIEALCCGCIVRDPYDMLETGGAAEIVHAWQDHGGEDYFKLERLRQDYVKELGL